MGHTVRVAYGPDAEPQGWPHSCWHIYAHELARSSSHPPREGSSAPSRGTLGSWLKAWSGAETQTRQAQGLRLGRIVCTVMHGPGDGLAA